MNITDDCPNCGSELVKRNGKHGNFIGCSNFPKCKFSASIVSKREYELRLEKTMLDSMVEKGERCFFDPNY